MREIPMPFTETPENVLPAAVSTGSFHVRNPWTGDIALTVEAAGAGGVERAPRIAAEAFRHHLKTPTHQRAAWLQNAAAELEKIRAEIVDATIAHIGKPRRAAEIEVGRRGASLPRV